MVEHSAQAVRRWFTTTHWSVVLNARSEDEACARAALSRLCETYWNTINVFIRARGFRPTEAEDLTQEFFARFLKEQQYRGADRTRGRFRSFLLGCVKHFLSKERDRAAAQKRGGGTTTVSLDETFEDGEPCTEIRDERTADQLFEQNWAIALLARARARLELQYAEDGKRERFLQLEKFLPGEESDLTYSDLAKLFGVPEGTVKSDVHRLKRRFAALVREEIANTVASSSEVEEELRHLRSVLATTRR
jgi:RNA polymerase sigma-70 factor (ECF subfamily)